MSRKGSTVKGWRELLSLTVKFEGGMTGEVWTTAPATHPLVVTGRTKRSSVYPFPSELVLQRFPGDHIETLWVCGSDGFVHWAAVEVESGKVIRSVRTEQRHGSGEQSLALVA